MRKRGDVDRKPVSGEVDLPSIPKGRESAQQQHGPTTTYKVPHDIVNEQVVIAAALVADDKSRARLFQKIQAEHFLDEQHRAIWRALVEMRHRKLDFDLATLARVAGDTVRIAYLNDLSRQRPDVPDNLDWHVDGLHWDRKRAAAVSGPLSSLLESLKNPSEAPERVRALARHLAESLDGATAGKHLIYDPKMLVAEQMAEIRRRIDGHAFYPFGMKGLDYFENGDRRMIPGCFPGGVTVITGVPGSGKSTFLANMLLGMVDDSMGTSKRRPLCGAWEMQAPMTLELLAVIRLGWSRSLLLDPKSSQLRDGTVFTPEMLIKFEETMHWVSERIRFAKNPFRRSRGSKKPSNEANLDIVHDLIAESGCDVASFDLWSRVLHSRKPEDEEEALFRQQAMSEETGVHSIIAHQQRHKDVEQRADKRPTREGIKGSGAYLETADNMIGVHRPAMWKQIDDDVLEAIILKQRYGKWPISVEFDWNPDLGSVTGGKTLAYARPGESETSSGEGFESFGSRFGSKRKGGKRGG